MVKMLAELTSTSEPAIDLIRQWAATSNHDVVVLPPSSDRESVLLHVQVTTRSTLGAVAYETGGILVDQGWLRFLGSGHPRLTRTLASWNNGRSDSFYLVADDAAGGFFAINGGAFGDDRGNVYYWSPDNLEWEALKLGYTDLLHWALTEDLAQFYADLRWPTWKQDLEQLSADRCFGFFPFLWSEHSPTNEMLRREISIEEAFDLKADVVKQLRQ